MSPMAAKDASEKEIVTSALATWRIAAATLHGCASKPKQGGPINLPQPYITQPLCGADQP